MSPFSRRTFLTTAAVVSAARASAPAGNLKAVVVGGHPGDPEYGCGGTVARLTASGHRVTILYLNRGQNGCPAMEPEQCGHTRTSEAEQACRILSAQPRFASQMDGAAIIDAKHYDEFHRLLHSEQPDLVFTHWPLDKHPDHRAAFTLVQDSWVSLRKSFALYYYEVSNGDDTLRFSPTTYVNITAVEPKKRAACYAHASQAPDKFYALQSEVTRFRGLEAGCPQAEAFFALDPNSRNIPPS